jgi:hypothetical protein
VTRSLHLRIQVQMSVQPLRELLEPLRRNLKELEEASGLDEDGLELARDRSLLRLHISTLEAALCFAARGAAAAAPSKIQH